MLQTLDAADSVRREVALRIPQKRKSELGQFMTPSSVARFMADMFPPGTTQICRLLDAGAGVGALSCAFLDSWLAGGFGFKTVETTAYEIDESLPVNSPKAVYQVEPSALKLLRSFGTGQWHDNLAAYLAKRETLVAKYAKERVQNRIPVEIAPGKEITLSPGEHSELIRAIVEDFAPRFAPGSVLIYAGDTGDKWGYFDATLLAGLGVDVDSHGKMPDVVLHFTAKNWLLLVESVTSHGPVDGKRHAELAKLFAGSKAGLVYVTAFPNRSLMSRYLGEIAWETEVWVADAPSHLIHFNGVRFLGPYAAEG